MASSPLAISGAQPQPTWVPYEPTKDCSQGLCSMYCPQWCYFIFPPPPPFDVGDPSPDDSSSGPVFSPFVIAIIGVLAVAFLLVSYYTFVSRYCGTLGSFRGRVFRSNSGGGRARGHGGNGGGGGGGGEGQLSRSQESWNVSPSTGLDETLISKISLCKYKRGDAAAAVHTTDCSVCLGEFRDGESLRLLPKCSHAFHQQCIDKWLKSHSNCPLCRSNITFLAVGTTGTATPEPDGRGPGASAPGSGRDAAREVVVVMEDLEIMCEEQPSMAGSADGSDGQEADGCGGPEAVDDAGSKAEIREECPAPPPIHDIRMSIADILQARMEDELMAARESGLLAAAGAGTSRRCHGENSRDWARGSRRASQDAVGSAPATAKRLPPAGRSRVGGKSSGRGRDSDLPL